MKKQANYKEGLIFHEMLIGSTIYYTKIISGFPTTYFVELTEKVNKTNFKGEVLSISYNGNTPEEPREEQIITVSRAGSCLVDENGFHYYFDALGRIGDYKVDEKTRVHPAYGMIQVNRFSGGHNTYFGSSIKHDGGISISISQAEVKRGLNHDWCHAKHIPFIEVNMSYTQFAEMITSGMNAEGTPCTITQLAGERIELCDFTNKKMEFQEEFNKDMESLKKKLDNLVTDSKEILSAKKAPNKGEKEMILNEIDNLTGSLTNHFTYLSSQWNEQLDKTVKEAKGEIEGFMESKVRTLGVQALQDMNVPEIEE